MLVSVLVMAFAVSLEPFRIGMTVLMLNRPRPMLQLLAFLSGGFAMGMTVGLVVLFVLRHRLPASTYFTLPGVQLLLGVLALLVAAVLVVKRPAGREAPPGRLARSSPF
jgi:Sap, sulfolipid-1-addressing protein